MEPLSWGTGHADVIAVREMLKDMGIDITELQDVPIEIEDDGE